MKLKKTMSVIAVLGMLLLGLTVASAQSDTTLPTTPDGRPMPGPGLSGICTDGIHLYVLAGPTVYQFTLPDLTLTNSLELPRPEPPATEE